ncbi:hypothetical protein LFL97_24035 [Burkholderia sp. JSH-S8]|nr:hypothetical protein LFL97_24035 [Burkholderia sp. JSH-S8]
MFDRINTLVSKMDFTLKLWADRYGRGTWAVCTPLRYHGDEICEASSDGDLDMIPATEYVLSTDWLPVVISSSVIEAMRELEERLGKLSDAALSQGSYWRGAVWDALDHFMNVRSARGDFEVLPKTLLRTEANTVPKNQTTYKVASLVTTEDELAVLSEQGDGYRDIHPICTIEPGADGCIVFKHGPVGLAVTEYDPDEEVAILRR